MAPGEKKTDLLSSLWRVREETDKTATVTVSGHGTLIGAL
jgi:hypothetical protein